jgi:hypothetical protein
MLKLADIRIKALIAGAVVDNALTLFLMNVLAAALVFAGISADEAFSRLKSANGLLLGLIIGLGCTGLGGYVAGRVAKQAEVLHGALVAAAGMVLALVFHDSKDPLWFSILGFVAMLPAGMAGGYSAHRRRMGSPTDRTPGAT